MSTYYTGTEYKTYALKSTGKEDKPPEPAKPTNPNEGFKRKKSDENTEGTFASWIDGKWSYHLTEQKVYPDEEVDDEEIDTEMPADYGSSFYCGG